MAAGLGLCNGYMGGTPMPHQLGLPALCLEALAAVDRA